MNTDNPVEALLIQQRDEAWAKLEATRKLCRQFADRAIESREIAEENMETAAGITHMGSAISLEIVVTLLNEIIGIADA